MPPIPIHSNDQISPQKAQGVTPQTVPVEASRQSYTPATTTASSDRNTYNAARPGAAAMPAPTGTASSAAYLPPAPTKTTQTPLNDPDVPPAPQPGAFAVPPQSNHHHVPPPPKAGERASYDPQSTSTPGPQMPPQMTYAPPTMNGAPTRSTETAAGPTAFRTTTLSIQAEHPPGYQQNPNADALSPEQRAATAEQERSDSIFANLQSGGETTSTAQGILGGTGGGANDSVWDTAKRLIGDVAENVKHFEGEVWKKVSKD